MPDMPVSTSGMIGRRYLTGNYGEVCVYRDADLADRNRIVGVVVLAGAHAGVRLGIPQHELGDRFPEAPDA